MRVDVPMPVLGFHLGAVSATHKHNLEVLAQTRAVARLWQRDLSLWPTYRTKKSGGAEQLNWLDLPGQLEPAVAQVAALASKLSGVGIQDVIFLSVSSCSLAAELIPALVLPTRGVRFHIVSRLEPSGLRSLERNLDFARTLFIVVSKSGKNLKVHALLLYFLAKHPSQNTLTAGQQTFPISCIFLDALQQHSRSAKIWRSPCPRSIQFFGTLAVSY